MNAIEEKHYILLQALSYYMYVYSHTHNIIISSMQCSDILVYFLVEVYKGDKSLGVEFQWVCIKVNKVTFSVCRNAVKSLKETFNTGILHKETQWVYDISRKGWNVNCSWHPERTVLRSFLYFFFKPILFSSLLDVFLPPDIVW